MKPVNVKAGSTVTAPFLLEKSVITAPPCLRTLKVQVEHTARNKIQTQPNVRDSYL